MQLSNTPQYCLLLAVIVLHVLFTLVLVGVCGMDKLSFQQNDRQKISSISPYQSLCLKYLQIL